MTSNVNWCQCDQLLLRGTVSSAFVFSSWPPFHTHPDTLWAPLSVVVLGLSQENENTQKKKKKKKWHPSFPSFTSSLPNGRQKGTAFTAMANVLVNTNLWGVTAKKKREGKRAVGKSYKKKGEPDPATDQPTRIGTWFLPRWTVIGSAATPLQAGHTAHTPHHTPRREYMHTHTPPCRFPHTCKQMCSLTKQRSRQGIHIQSISSLDTQPVDHYAKYALWRGWALNNNHPLSAAVPCKVHIFMLRPKNMAPGFSFVVGNKSNRCSGTEC